ncbi:7TM GPCR, serpentine receptor class r (Str) family-containing protein [Strongyloides ratti]|uniref:7TM GPCR, serpentine receptor class r (Str) family-containing protein n=1 Tax=Strongyloides ratti TaxID=34506 RepID=A0A090MXE3_STRRB|nr:7TM GPCR, serpentine receptor class r (Str) family-containing protein [Strongyloides ratti]CEF65284.1 7TM GPCR, serpentine receptor class r (Str) family-containing protein [Strongyloides ratti]
MIYELISNFKHLQFKFKLSDILSIYTSFLVNILSLAILFIYKNKNDLKSYRNLVFCQFIYGLIFSFYNIFVKLYCLSSDGYFICGFETSFIKPPNEYGTVIFYYFYFCLLNHCMFSTISITIYRYFKICKNILNEYFYSNILIYIPLIISYIINISIIIAFFPNYNQKQNIKYILEKNHFYHLNMTTFSKLVYSKTDNIPFIVHMLSVATLNIIIYLFVLYIHKKIQTCLKESRRFVETTRKIHKSFSKLLFLQIFCPWIFSFLPVTVFCLFCTFGGQTYLFASILIRGFNWLPALNGFIFLIAPKRNRKFIKIHIKLIFLFLFSCNFLKNNTQISNNIKKLNDNSNSKDENKNFI